MAQVVDSYADIIEYKLANNPSNPQKHKDICSNREIAVHNQSLPVTQYMIIHYTFLIL